jgi:CheY-like chemotaxis protein
MLDINILVVDDNDGDLLLFEESIEIVQEFLSEKDIIVNFAVKTASDGLDALEIIEKVNINFDIIFLDIKMPKWMELNV